MNAYVKDALRDALNSSIDVVVVGGGPWSPDINFPIHHTARILSRRHRVLYLYRDSHTSLLGHLGGRLPGFHDARELTANVVARPRIERVGERLWVSALAGPAALLPLSYPPASRALAAQLVVRRLRRAIKDLEFQNPLLWFYWWFFPEIARQVPHCGAVYDIYDDHSEYDFVRDDAKRKAYTLRQERLLLKEVDLAFAVSHRLVTLKSGDAPVHYLPNGVDIEMAAAAGQGPTPVEVAGMPRPIVGYLGSYDSRMNWSLVEEMARARPTWSFVFVGGGSTMPLSCPPNLHLLGNRDYPDALRIVNAFDVALIPFVRDALTEAICPAKLFDYLALGKPIISTPLPAVDEVVGNGDLVYRGVTASDFVVRAEQALHESPDLAALRRDLARSLTWDHRVERATAMFDEKLRTSQSCQMDAVHVE